MTDEPMPFDRQPGESKQAYEAACLYFDTPPGTARSLREVARKLNKSGALVGRWSSVWSWPSRALAWDAEIEQKARQQKQSEHVAALLDYQRRMANKAKALNHMAAGLSSITGSEIARRFREPEHLSGGELAALSRAIALLTEAALGLEGASLSVPQLVAVIEGKSET